MIFYKVKTGNIQKVHNLMVGVHLYLCFDDLRMKERRNLSRFRPVDIYYISGRQEYDMSSNSDVYSAARRHYRDQKIVVSTEKLYNDSR